MSAESARILKKIIEKVPGGGTPLALGTIESVAPLSVQLDDVDFTISKGLLVNSLLLQHSRRGSASASPVGLSNATFTMEGVLAKNDRVLVARISNACNVIVCKVVSV